MGADKARVSYDDKQEYRSVVIQQGRVTLEAVGAQYEDLLKQLPTSPNL